MISFVQKFLLVLGFLEGLDSESTFEVVRHSFKWVGENKVVLFDPRIGLDDQVLNLIK